MIFASSNLLGIAVSDRSITCAELSGKGDRLSAKTTATFTLPADLSLEKPDALGAALATFLKQNGFSASEAVVGIPARWLIAAEKDVPPAGRDQMRTLLRMQAERLPLADAGELVCEYVGEHDSSKPSKVLLIAILRKQLERIEKTMEAAGLKLAAVTPTALALASVASGRVGPASRNTSFLMLGNSSAELVYQRSGTPRILRHVGIAANGHGLSIAPLGTELRRAVAMAPSTGTNGDSTSEMVLWDSIGLKDAQVAELSERSGLKVRSGDGLAMLGVKAQPRTSRSADAVDPEQFAPAIALAIAGANPTLMPFDFTDSRLAPVVASRFGTKTVWGGIIAALVIIGVTTMLVQNNIKARELARIQAQRSERAADITKASALQTRVDFTGQYFDNRSQMLECFRDLSNCFRDSDPMWATNFAVKASSDPATPNRLEATLEGKTTDPLAVKELVPRMRLNQRFEEIETPTITPSGSGRQAGQASFTMKFKYVPPKAGK